MKQTDDYAKDVECDCGQSICISGVVKIAVEYIREEWEDHSLDAQVSFDFQLCIRDLTMTAMPTKR